MIKLTREFLYIPVLAVPADSAGNIDYLIGGIVALLILLYLICTIARPEKF